MEKRKRSRFDVAEEDFRAILEKKLRSPLEFSWKDGCATLPGGSLVELSVGFQGGSKNNMLCGISPNHGWTCYKLNKPAQIC